MRKTATALAAAAALAAVTSHCLPAGAQNTALDLTGYTKTFDEKFTRLDISAHGPATEWIAHTPWNGDFGNDVFDDPGPGGPFTATPDGLTITAHQDASGNWHGGLICSVDRDGTGQYGFTQRYGYFEMTAQLPGGAGVWPAFWLIGADKTQAVSEIDVMEYYGHAPGEYHITEHDWIHGKDMLGAWHVVPVPRNALTSRFNQYGVLITPKTMTYYFNRHPVWSTPTPPEYRQKVYLLANLAIGGGWPYGGLPSPRVMTIREIQVYQTK